MTSGPGLQGALLVGLQVAKSLSLASGVPLVGVNHLEGHLLAIRLAADAPEPPFLGLVVSGGHTTLYDVPAFGTYKRLGTTRESHCENSRQAMRKRRPTTSATRKVAAATAASQ